MNFSSKILFKLIAFFSFSLISIVAFGQDGSLTWRNPLAEKANVIQGQAWINELKGSYKRLPARMESLVRKPVWNLSQNSTGIYIEFKTNAPEFSVRYAVKGPLGLPHMPSTSVSGVDLYAKGSKGWEWAAGKYSFGDTIIYRFNNLDVRAEKTFRLYLPLYNSVDWLEIGTDKKFSFAYLPTTEEKPILIYGTSIAQGACASRPGLAWTNILGRKLNMPIVNMAFSGNGRLEEPLIDLMSETDARMYVLDCMPNLSSATYSKEEIKKKVFYAVKRLQKANKNTPILLVENSGGSTDLVIDTLKNFNYRRTSSFLRAAFDELKSSGVKNIHLLSNQDIGMGTSSTVDGTHPNDIGMMEHALAYEKIIISILGKKSTY